MKVKMVNQPAASAATNNLEGITLLNEPSSGGHLFYWRPKTEDFVVFEDVVDRNEYRLPPQFKPDDIIIDIGAHIGSFSYAVALRRPGKIFAYEAHPVNHAIATKNLERFGDVVSCRNLAVWRSDRPSETLYNEDISGYEGTGGVSLLWNNEGLPVSTVSLDDVLCEASNGFTSRIRFLKIDCEGAEYPILFTAKHLEIVDEICGEYHEMGSELIPERARVDGQQTFDRFALKKFLSGQGWLVKIEPRGKTDGLFKAQLNRLGGSASHKPEIDIDELKARIRTAVELRQADGRTNFIKTSGELFELLSAQLSGPTSISIADTALSVAETPYLTRLSLQPEFLPRSDDHYHVDDLLKYHDSQFIGNVYRALLRREPDEPGLNTYLDKLRSGRFNKIDVLANIRFSEEGRRNNVPVDGLRGRAAIRRCYRLPLLGYLIELAVGIIRLPSFIRNQRAIETHLIAQQDRTAVHFNNTVDAFAQHIDATNQALRHDTRNLREAVTRLNESLSSSFSRLTNEQKRFAQLQHQQLSALFLMQQNAESGSSNGNRSDVKNYFDQDRSSGSLGNLDEIYANFQRQFRGDFNAVKESLKVYLPLLSETAIKEGILDLGCGRGEWLQLLQEAGLQARGIESNKVLATQARGRNLEVIESDALLYLRRLPENSLNAVTAFHFIEHVGFEELIELLSEISRILTPGGLLIIETPNPKNLVVGACNFYSDPTHRQPLFPETLEFLIQQFRFARTHIRYLHPVAASPFTSADAAQQALNSWFFSGRDYSLVGWNS